MKLTRLGYLDGYNIPLTKTEVKNQLLLVDPDGSLDTQLDALIADVLAYLEECTGRQIRPARYTLETCNIASDGVIKLRKPPLIEVESVEMRINEVTTTIESDEYVTDMLGRTAALYPVTSWPAHDAGRDSVKVTFTCGYTSQDAWDMQRLALMWCSVWWEDRTGQGGAHARAAAHSAEIMMRKFRVF